MAEIGWRTKRRKEGKKRKEIANKKAKKRKSRNVANVRLRTRAWLETVRNGNLGKGDRERCTDGRDVRTGMERETGEMYGRERCTDGQ